jgi:hypothetical protein
LLPGDFIDATLELVVFPGDASAYYGPDAAFRHALAGSADSWRLVLREAAGNDFSITTRTGRITLPYPLSVQTSASGAADLTLHGGLGHIPVSFTHLPSPHGFSLAAGNSREQHWQTDWDAETGTWRATFNVAAPPAGESLRLRFAPTP